MKKIGLIALVPLILMVVSMISPMAAKAQGPGSVTTDVYYDATIAWGPGRADPARIYDTASGALVFNTYDTLITGFGEKYYEFNASISSNVPDRVVTTLTVTSTGTPDLAAPAGSEWSGWTLIAFQDQNVTGALNSGDVVYMNKTGEFRTWFVTSLTGAGPYTMNLWRGSYTFHIRTDVTMNFLNWSTGAINDQLDAEDVEFSFERGLVHDQAYSPQWMYYKAFFDQMDMSFFWNNFPDNVTLVNLIDDAVERSGNDVTLNVGCPFPDNAWKQTLSNTWGSIVSKKYTQQIGDWAGDLYADGNANGNPDSIEFYSMWYFNGRTPYDVTTGRKWCGTGPFYVKTYDPTNAIVELQQNPGYWKGWPMAGAKSNVTKVIISYVSSWDARRNGLIAGSYDAALVPRAYMFQILDNTTKEPAYSSIKTIKAISPGLSMDAIHFCFSVDPTSAYIYNGTFPNGIPYNFFNYTLARKAFAYAFNWSNYKRDAWFGEATYRNNVWINGLYPDYYNPAIGGYEQSFANAEQALKDLKFGGVSVWDSGFKLALVYNEGNDQRRIACELIKDFFDTLNTYDSRSGTPKLDVQIVTVLWDAYNTLYESSLLPLFNVGWLADFADADNFVRPYMHSQGDFSSMQYYTTANGWGPRKDQLIDTALLIVDETERRAAYVELQQIYKDELPQIPLVVPDGRRFCNYWVRGWYYNAIYPSQFFYSLWKEDTCWYDISGPTIGVSDGSANMRDINYLVGRFNGKAPTPGQPDDPKWVGTYGCGGTDPYGDRLSNMRDISWTIQHFNHHTGQP